MLDATIPTDLLARFEKLYLTGRVEQADGNTREALAAYREAAQLAESVRISLVGEEHKIAIEASRAQVAERAVALLIGGLADSHRPKGEAKRSSRAGRARASRVDAEVFEFVEGAKARALGDLLGALSLSRRETRAKEGMARERIASATRKLSWQAAKLEQAQLAMGDASEITPHLARRVAGCERRIASLMRALSEEEIGERAPAGPSGPLSLDAARRHLGEGEVVVEYFAAEGRLCAFRIERQSARLVALDATLAQIDRLVSRFFFQVETARVARDSLTAHSDRLRETATRLMREAHELLMAPLGVLPRDARLTMIPHGALNRLPLQAFDDGAGPLIARFFVGNAPSFATFVKLRSLARSPNRKTLVGGHADEKAPEIRREISAVARALRRQRPTVRGAIRSDEFLDLAPRARLIHLATHARYRDDNPLFSAVRLADRWVHLYEILNIDLDAELVVLSGCETGAGRHFAGDEILGLARGFLARGARRLIVSLWPVDDPSTARLAEHFHRVHASGVDALGALREASLAIREENPHPYHWAPFTLLGA
jgi:hypothetical protein